MVSVLNCKMFFFFFQFTPIEWYKSGIIRSTLNLIDRNNSSRYFKQLRSELKIYYRYTTVFGLFSEQIAK